MNNLFSIFDPQTHSNFYLNWMSSLFILTMIPCSFWLTKSNSKKLIQELSHYIHMEMKAVLGPISIPGSSFIMVSMFLFIMLNNFLGLFPYIFTSTAHLTLAVAIALPLWIGHVLYAWAKVPQSMLAHLVPLGTPPALMPFMVIIELVSNVIRPLTLSVRLAANMVAGHLLLTLLSSSAIFSQMYLLPLLVGSLILLATLESAVAIIQAYVFSILSTLYVSDIETKSFLNFYNFNI